MTTAILFVLGTAVGSFLNVIGSRWGTDGVLSGRSHCPSCRKSLKWHELVPVISFLIQKARCRGCQAKISWQYPAVEILTGLVFATIFNLPAGEAGLQFSILQSLLFLTIFCIYIIIVIYDIHHKIIPDRLVYPAILLSVVSRWLLGNSPLDWFAGPILFVFFASIWFLSRGRAMGFGDAKLGLSVGLLLGAAQGFSAIVLAFWIGALGSLVYIFLNKAGLPAGKAGFLKNAKSLTIKSEVPFAPFIVIGAWISLVFQFDILHVALF